MPAFLSMGCDQLSASEHAGALSRFALSPPEPAPVRLGEFRCDIHKPAEMTVLGSAFFEVRPTFRSALFSPELRLSIHVERLEPGALTPGQYPLGRYDQRGEFFVRWTQPSLSNDVHSAHNPVAGLITFDEVSSTKVSGRLDVLIRGQNSAGETREILATGEFRARATLTETATR